MLYRDERRSRVSAPVLSLFSSRCFFVRSTFFVTLNASAPLSECVLDEMVPKAVWQLQGIAVLSKDVQCYQVTPISRR